MKFLHILKPMIFIFYFKQFWFTRKFANRLTITGYRFSREPLVQILIDAESHIHFGFKTHLRKSVDIEAYDGAEITIGDHFFMNKNSSIIARYGIEIGNNCMIGENTTITDHNHTFKNSKTPYNTQGYRGSKIIIGNNVWIAGRVFIGHGVRIGDNVVIGANTVVTKSIPSNSVVYGKTELIIKSTLGCKNSNDYN